MKNITAPWLLSSRMISNSFFFSAVVNDAVGSSKSSILPPHDSARAISTIWRSPIGRSPTLAVGLMSQSIMRRYFFASSLSFL